MFQFFTFIPAHFSTAFSFCINYIELLWYLAKNTMCILTFTQELSLFATEKLNNPHMNNREEEKTPMLFMNLDGFWRTTNMFYYR